MHVGYHFIDSSLPTNTQPPSYESYMALWTTGPKISCLAVKILVEKTVWTRHLRDFSSETRINGSSGRMKNVGTEQ